MSPTINFTNATGSFTYEEAATPPTQPPPEQGGGEGPTGGKITKFNSTPKQDLTIDTTNYQVMTAGRDYSLKQVDDYTLRFEIRPGDHAWFDGSSVDRSQMEQRKRYAAGAVTKMAWRITVEPGGNNNADWFVTAEIHNDDEEGGQATSPPLAIELAGEKFRIVTRTCKAGGNPSNNSPDLKYAEPWTMPQNLVRGKEYVFEIEAKCDQTNGYLKIWLDGASIVDRPGGLGYGYTTYWLFGPYRNSGGPSFAAKYKNITIGA